ncbi:hypothetical protein OF83DRAFT_1087434 [Amylostereum chailletii]|nr:hypothetical protein OF83DRAFT_1087434 [Amylostereum chailletii]
MIAYWWFSAHTRTATKTTHFSAPARHDLGSTSSWYTIRGQSQSHVIYVQSNFVGAAQIEIIPKTRDDDSGQCCASTICYAKLPQLLCQGYLSIESDRGFFTVKTELMNLSRRIVPGHIDSINILDFSSDGVFCVSGGDDGLFRVFSGDLEKEFRCWQSMTPVTTLVWSRRFPKIFLMDDYVSLQHVGDAEIASMASEATFLAIACDHSVFIMKQSTMASWAGKHELPAPPSFPEIENSARKAEILPCDMSFLCTSLHGVGQHNGIVPITYIHGGDTVLVGASNGAVRILDANNGSTLQALPHGMSQLIQAMAYIKVGNEHRIMTGVTEKGSCNVICLWTAVDEDIEKDSSSATTSRFEGISPYVNTSIYVRASIYSSQTAILAIIVLVVAASSFPQWIYPSGLRSLLWPSQMVPVVSSGSVIVEDVFRFESVSPSFKPYDYPESDDPLDGGAIMAERFVSRDAASVHFPPEVTRTVVAY